MPRIPGVFANPGTPSRPGPLNHLGPSNASAGAVSLNHISAAPPPGQRLPFLWRPPFIFARFERASPKEVLG